MRILAVTNMYPTPEEPYIGTFVEQQIKGLRDSGTEVEVVHINRRREGMKSYWGVGSRVHQRAQEVRPDLVHVMYGGVMADQVTQALGTCPVFVSFCGSDLLGELLSGWKRRMLAAYGVLASRRAARRARGIIVKSRNLEQALPAKIERRKVRIIPNGVDLDRFKPLDQQACRVRLGWDAETFRVLFPANVGDPRKRPWLAEAAVAELARDGVRCELARLQGIPHSEVPIWLNASDCVVITSLFEGSVNVVKEALACDVPVVSLDVGDVAELIEGVEGCHLASDQPRSLADKLGEVHRRAKPVHAREKMKSLSLERIAERLVAFYQEMLRP